MKIVCSIFAFIILAGTGLLYFSLTNQTEYTECNMDVPVLFCGTVSPPLSEEAKVGKQLFYANCAACHKLDK
ncbi:hypothetical protein [Kordia sp.]|uniref:hypothetical protein n=1 Tax=Kordia sp. TaxID=1965332 RepID=UPI003D2D9E87